MRFVNSQRMLKIQFSLHYREFLLVNELSERYTRHERTSAESQQTAERFVEMVRLAKKGGNSFRRVEIASALIRASSGQTLVSYSFRPRRRAVMEQSVQRRRCSCSVTKDSPTLSASSNVPVLPQLRTYSLSTGWENVWSLSVQAHNPISHRA